MENLWDDENEPQLEYYASMVKIKKSVYTEGMFIESLNFIFFKIKR